MLRKVGSTAFSTILFCLSISPLPLLALQLAVPTRSSDNKKVHLNWTEGAGDPKAVYLQIVCGLTLIPLDRVLVLVSNHLLSIAVDPNITTEESPVDCRLYAFDGPKFGLPIYQSNTFRTLQVTQPLPTPPVVTTFSTLPELKPTELLPAPPIVTTFSTLPEPKPTEPKPVGPGDPKTAPATTTSTASSQGALIGGTLGGLALLASLVIYLFFLRLRRKRNSPSFTTTMPLQQRRTTETHNGTPREGTRSHFHNAAEAARNTIMSCVSSPFRRQVVHSPIINPLTQSEGYLPPEGKRARLERIHREMEESRRQREMLQSDLDSRSNRHTVTDRSEVGVDNEVERRLRQQIEAMSRRIEELEAEQQMEAPPPDYYSSVLRG